MMSIDEIAHNNGFPRLSQLAAAAKVEPATLYNLKNNKRKPTGMTVGTACALARACRMSLSKFVYLLTDDADVL